MFRRSGHRFADRNMHQSILSRACPDSEGTGHALELETEEEQMDGALEKSAMRKIYIRLLPFAVLSYILAYIDRINVSFAGLTMRGDLGLSAGDFGFATGMFFWGYFLFEVPSNLVLEKGGPRLWIARI